VGRSASTYDHVVKSRAGEATVGTRKALGGSEQLLVVALVEESRSIRCGGAVVESLGHGGDRGNRGNRCRNSKKSGETHGLLFV
jgi:hypothetical protein